MKFELPALYPIINLDTAEDPLGYCKTLLQCGISIIQLRAKELPDSSFNEIALSVIELARGLGKQPAPLVIINDRIEICLKTEADGVHLGIGDISPAAARKALGPRAVIGFSTHSLEQVLAAQTCGADYLGFGPVFQTTGKTHPDPVVGLELLCEAIQISNLPVVAIGGIELKNVEEVYRSNARTVAAIGDLERAKDKGRQVGLYHEIFRKVFEEKRGRNAASTKKAAATYPSSDS